jgi:peptidoglycan/xylan/chitin deacetylase (PgdA/CDA1 family)
MSVAVLAFHAVDDGPGPLCFPPSRFAQLVAEFQRYGATALTVEAAAAALAGAGPLPERAVAFTFDDAYASVHTRALPILDRAGYPGTVFQVGGAIGGRNEWDPTGSSVGGRALLDGAQLRDLCAHGWQVGGHTMSHRVLRGLAAEAVAAEIDAGNERVAEVVGTAPSVFAYPYGVHDDVSRAVAGARHRACVTIGAAVAPRGVDPATIPRVEAWYLRRPWTVRHLFDAQGRAYLAGRRAARTVRARLPG